MATNIGEHIGRRLEHQKNPTLMQNIMQADLGKFAIVNYLLGNRSAVARGMVTPELVIREASHPIRAIKRAVNIQKDRRAWQGVYKTINYVADITESRGDQFTFIQIGAKDGIENDPLRPLIKDRPEWRGLLIEPRVDYVDKLRHLYGQFPDYSTLRCAVTESNGSSKLTIPRSKDDPVIDGMLSGGATLGGLNQLPSWARNSLTHTETIDVPTRTLESVIESELEGKAPDLLFVDAEGYDGKIVRQIPDLPFSMGKPSFVVFEHTGISPEELDHTISTLNSAGYQENIMRNDIFCTQI